MIGLDTNVIVRFLADDDPEQGALARRLFARLTADEPGFIGREVMVELFWVLSRAYGFGRETLADAMEGLIAADEILIEDHDAVAVLVHRFRTERADFADLMIVDAARRAGCSTLVTFDRRAAALPGAKALS